MTVREFKEKANQKLSALYDSSESAAIVRFMLEDLAGIKHLHLSSPNDNLAKEQISSLDLALQRLLQGEPYQYVTGKQLFAGQWFEVNPAVLIPRPETEELYRLVVEWCKTRSFIPRVVIDHCTGSGCLAISLKRAFPTAHVIGTDISLDALSVARKNAAKLEAPVEFLHMDVLADDVGPLLPDKVDIVISNPPYVLPTEATDMHPSVLNHEPKVALFVPKDDPLVFYSRILGKSLHALSVPGLIAFEINPMYATELQNEFSKFLETEILMDLSGKKRFLFAHKSF